MDEIQRAYEPADGEQYFPAPIPDEKAGPFPRNWLDEVPTRTYDPFMGEFVAPPRLGGIREQLIQGALDRQASQEIPSSDMSMSRLGRVLTYLGLKDSNNG